MQYITWLYVYMYMYMLCTHYIIIVSDDVMLHSRMCIIHVHCTCPIFFLPVLPQTVGKLIADFDGEPTYKAAHVFFLES